MLDLFNDNGELDPDIEEEFNKITDEEGPIIPDAADEADQEEDDDSQN